MLSRMVGTCFLQLSFSLGKPNLLSTGRDHTARNRLKRNFDVHRYLLVPYYEVIHRNIMYTDAYLVSGVNKLAGHVVPVQWRSRCENIELATAECVTAYGFSRGKEKCKDLLSDLFECIYNIKQNIRLETMYAEHQRQMKKGQREYIPTPHISYFYV